MRIVHCLTFILCMLSIRTFSQDTLARRDTTPANLNPVLHDTLPVHDSAVVPVPVFEDTTLRITNLNPYITLHVDSSLIYKLDINRTTTNFFWYLRNAPVGLKINKDNGLLTFKAEKSFFSFRPA